MALCLFTALLSNMLSVMSFTRLSRAPQRARLSETAHVRRQKDNTGLWPHNIVSWMMSRWGRCDCCSAIRHSRYSNCPTTHSLNLPDHSSNPGLVASLQLLNPPPPPSSRLTSSFSPGQRQHIRKLRNRGCTKKETGFFSNAHHYPMHRSNLGNDSLKRRWFRCKAVLRSKENTTTNCSMRQR